MHKEAADLPIVEIDERYHNLIPSRFPIVPLFERIAHGRDDLFAQIESMTNPRLAEKNRLTHGMAPVDQEQPRFKNWNHAPFVYTNPEGSLFFNPDRNVVELAADLQTALAISVAKRETFLRRTGEPKTVIEIRQIVRPVRGRYVDTRELGLIESRKLRLELGRFAVSESLDGILYRPEERPSGTGLVAMKSECLGQPTQADHFKYLWDGLRVDLLYSFRKGKPFDPADLTSEDTILAA